MEAEKLYPAINWLANWAAFPGEMVEVNMGSLVEVNDLNQISRLDAAIFLLA